MARANEAKDLVNKLGVTQNRDQVALLVACISPVGE